MLGFLGKKNSEAVILDAKMSNKCLVLIICVAFVGVTLYTFFLVALRNEASTRYPTLNLHHLINSKFLVS